MNQGTYKHLLGDRLAYLDGETSAELCAEIEHHLAGCENCAWRYMPYAKPSRSARPPQPGLSADACQRLYKSLDLTQFMTPPHKSSK